MNTSGELQIVHPRFAAALHGLVDALHSAPSLRVPAFDPSDQAILLEIPPLEYQTGAAQHLDD